MVAKGVFESLDSIRGPLAEIQGDQIRDFQRRMLPSVGPQNFRGQTSHLSHLSQTDIINLLNEKCATIGSGVFGHVFETEANLCVKVCWNAQTASTEYNKHVAVYQAALENSKDLSWITKPYTTDFNEVVSVQSRIFVLDPISRHDRRFVKTNEDQWMEDNRLLNSSRPYGAEPIFRGDPAVPGYNVTYEPVVDAQIMWALVNDAVMQESLNMLSGELIQPILQESAHHAAGAAVATAAGGAIAGGGVGGGSVGSGSLAALGPPGWIALVVGAVVMVATSVGGNYLAYRMRKKDRSYRSITSLRMYAQELIGDKCETLWMVLSRCHLDISEWETHSSPKINPEYLRFVFNIASECGKSVAKLHKTGWCHHDLHFNNIIFDHNSKRVAIVDWGLAEQVPDEVDRSFTPSAPGFFRNTTTNTMQFIEYTIDGRIPPVLTSIPWGGDDVYAEFTKGYRTEFST